MLEREDVTLNLRAAHAILNLRTVAPPRRYGTIARWGDSTDVNDQIRQIIADHGRLPVDVHTLDDHADLYQAGMTSHASVNVMLALEDAFEVEFPDAMLRRSVFESVASIAATLTALEAPAT